MNLPTPIEVRTAPGRIGVICPNTEPWVRRVAQLVDLPVHEADGNGLILNPAPDRPLDALWLVAHAGRGLDAGTRAALARWRDRPDAPPLLLALVQEGAPQGTWRWLEALKPALHLHLRTQADLARWGRHLTGQAVALVLGGGGARGFAHLGVWQALDELGVEVDVVAGASMGAVIGSQLASGRSSEVALACTREAFLGGGGCRDYRRPGLSLLAGERLSGRLAAMLGERTRIEDLPLPFACTTSNLQRCALEVHRQGLLWRTVVASGSIPCMAPPCELDGELHVDGGLLDVLPVDAARLPGVGQIIAVDVLTPSTRPLALPRRTGLRLLLQRFRPGGDRSLLTLPDLLQRSLALSAVHSGQKNQQSADLVIRPPLSRFSITEPGPFDAIVEQGHAQAQRDLERWQGPISRPRRVRQQAAPLLPARPAPEPPPSRPVPLEELSTPLRRVAGPFCLPQHADPGEQRTRRAALEQARLDYAWEEEPGLPPYARGLPAPERLTGAKKAWVKGSFPIGALRGAALAAVAAASGRSLATFDRLGDVALRPAPESRARWLDDDWFAQQRLSGNNPVIIEHIDRVPDHLGVTDDQARGLLEGRTLADAGAEGRLYLCDYRMLAGLPRHPGRHVADAMALFFQREDGELAPVAIQLGQDPSRDLVFTPHDTQADWTLAKLHVQCADGNHHQWVSHLSMTHYALDPFICATHRSLPPSHPVHALLRPHLRWTLGINHIARESVAGNQGTFARMKSLGTVGGYPLARSYLAEHSLLDDGLEEHLGRRRVQDGLPTYHFRDDARRVRGPLSTYVDGVLRLFYADSAEVIADTELEAWRAELAGPGRVRGLPGRFTRREQLHDVLVRLIFRASVWHEGISAWQHEGYSHVPNMPHGLWVPAPTERGRATMDDVLRALPPTKLSILQMVAATITPTPNLSTLTAPDRPAFPGCPEAEAHRQALTDALLQVSATLAERNTQRRNPYTVLDPQRIAESTEV
ncbi:MAG: patatin-like phospholipase family protein [Alphaproteobacteria bacterium]|nr:patatin-like phospholipase family protein [Alphaproteobacteria bacterium]